MAMSRAGFFRELRHGSPDGPTLSESRRGEAQPDEALIVRYLESAPFLAVTGSFVDDYLNPANKAVARLMIMTDGAWRWPRDLAYYVREYHVQPPADFVAHMRQRSWEPPALTPDDLARMAREEFPQASRPPSPPPAPQPPAPPALG
jgi:hypothetical protein